MISITEYNMLENSMLLFIIVQSGLIIMDLFYRQYKNIIFLILGILISITFVEYTTLLCLDKIYICKLYNVALSTSFYEREHTKPIFKLNTILCMYNLYTYLSFMESFKIIKLRLPTALYSEYHLAHNRHTRLITPSPSRDSYINNIC